MGLFNLFKTKNQTVTNSNLVAVCSGEMIEAAKIPDEMFAKEMIGQTIGFIPQKDTMVSPCNGVLEVLFPTGHAFAVRMEDGTGVLVHLGIDTVNLNGKGFKVFAKVGEEVKAGQKIVDMDLEYIEEKGLSTTTMLIISEPVENKTYNFKDFGFKKQGEIIL